MPHAPPSLRLSPRLHDGCNGGSALGPPSDGHQGRGTTSSSPRSPTPISRFAQAWGPPARRVPALVGLPTLVRTGDPGVVRAVLELTRAPKRYRDSGAGRSTRVFSTTQVPRRSRTSGAIVSSRWSLSAAVGDEIWKMWFSRGYVTMVTSVLPPRAQAARRAAAFSTAGTWPSSAQRRVVPLDEGVEHLIRDRRTAAPLCRGGSVGRR